MGDTVSEELIQQLRDAVLRQLSAPADEREQALAAVHEAVKACTTDPLERFQVLTDAQDWAHARARELDRAASTVHIRKKAGPNLGNQYYSHSTRMRFVGDYREPQSETLCGAKASNFDMSWAETRYPKNRAFVECERCIEIRLKDGKALR
ncbi:hypothetical protein QDT91_29525 (plasmid) [Mycolicibacterium aubagnense]|uniref:hypothetical protein n=1 Tax=Mycolicibacterium aubagnense TaxID=319707 RepID=UPI00244DDB03|nr:hypothetical protein [Mycolicibacterium aubagnense]WGI36159.1 hypothetical protein QDT91_29525 [Mycolicibacterium aubagnense]